MTDQNDATGHAPDPPCEHCGIFTLGGNIPILGAWRDITFVPVRDNIWSVSEELNVVAELNTGLFTAPNARQYLDREPRMHVDRISERLWTISDGVRRSLFVEGDTSVVALMGGYSLEDTPAAGILLADQVA